MVIVVRFHLFPFRTEKLSSLTPMVLHLSCGRVGSRLFKVRPYGLTFCFPRFPAALVFAPFLLISFPRIATTTTPFTESVPLRREDDCEGKGREAVGSGSQPSLPPGFFDKISSDTETVPESPHDAPILLRRLSSILRRRSFKVRLPKWGLFEAPARTRPICKHGSAAKVPTVGRVQRLGNPTEYKCI